jgi:hypothetical protein
MEKRQRLGKEREIMECVKDIFLNSFPHPKKAITYQLSYQHRGQRSVLQAKRFRK